MTREDSSEAYDNRMAGHYDSGTITNKRTG